jgi:hypothetical protein
MLEREKRMVEVWYKKFCVFLLTLVTLLFLSPNLYAVQVGISAPSIPQVVLGVPPQVIITGIFAPSKGTVKPGLATLTVSIHKEKKKFIVKDILALNSDATPLQILDLISPPRLIFWGNKELLNRLAKPQIEGKVFRLQGTLYASDGVFFVSSGEAVS